VSKDLDSAANATSDGPDAQKLAGLDDELEVRIIRDREEYRASRKLSSIEAGRRKGGLLGAALAGAMVTLSELYEGKEIKDDIEEVSESAGKVGDIDKDGIGLTVAGVNVHTELPS
jgi:CO/xanthine dehydrogenase FAD-binding subunit